MTDQLGSADMSAPSVESSGIAFAPTVTPDTYQDASSTSVHYPLSEAEMLSINLEDLEPRRSSNSRRKAPDHIPRPPNAFILFRSAFIKSQRVSSGVESSHSTLSKIIGLTWQQLSNEERQKWHAKAKVAQDEHKRRYPQYSFRPIHNRLRGVHGEGQTKRKLREIGPKDQKRCEKIAELLSSGKKGEELEEAIKEFDKYHVPQIMTRFEEPITASSFSTSSRGSSPYSVRSRRSATPSSQGRSSTGTPRSGAVPTPPPLSVQINEYFEQDAHVPSAPLPLDANTLFSNPTHSFAIDNFTFSVQEPSPSMTPVVSPSVGGFNLATGQEHNPSDLLCQPFPHIDEWAPPCSPISTNSTGSLPTTPAPIGVPFQEGHTGIYDSQTAYTSFGAPDASTQKYATKSHYYPSYTSDCQPYPAPIPLHPTDYRAKRTLDTQSCFLTPNIQAHGYQVPPMAREDLDFSYFMASLDPSYPL